MIVWIVCDWAFANNNLYWSSDFFFFSSSSGAWQPKINRTEDFSDLEVWTDKLGVETVCSLLCFSTLESTRIREEL